MNISTLTKRIVVLLVAVAATAPVALAGAPQSAGGHLGKSANVPTAQCPCNIGLPGGPAGVTPVRTERLASTSSSGCPCNVGLPGGPAGVTPVRTERLSSTSFSGCPCNVGLPVGPAGVRRSALVSATVPDPGGSFNWGDAGAGAGFTAGIAMLVGGAALALRRHRVIARPHS
jgi:hypothetical protein